MFVFNYSNYALIASWTFAFLRFLCEFGVVCIMQEREKDRIDYGKLQDQFVSVFLVSLNKNKS